jgi:hypothetical protein
MEEMETWESPSDAGHACAARSEIGPHAMRNRCMQNRELYRRILGIECPWQVERVELKLESGEIHVYLEHEPGPADRARNVPPPARSTITSRNGAGGTWTPASVNHPARQAAKYHLQGARRESADAATGP